MELPEKKLSDAELDIMLAIWQSPPPVQRADLEEQLRSHNWADTTLLTLLSKLVEKGYLFGGAAGPAQPVPSPSQRGGLPPLGQPQLFGEDVPVLPSPHGGIPGGKPGPDRP